MARHQRTLYAGRRCRAIEPRTLEPQSANCRTQVDPERTRVGPVKWERAREARGKGIEISRFLAGLK
jgi:hypothetical protein